MDAAKLHVTLRLERLEPRHLPSALPTGLRVVIYNVTSAGGLPRLGLTTILDALGTEAVGGRARPVDVFALQEVQRQATTTQAVVDLLNSVYGDGAYARGLLDGATTGSGTQGLVYNTRTVQLLGEAAVGTASPTGQPRQALRYQLRAAGTEFYVYNSHYKAGQTADDQRRRLVEAGAIRTDADALGEGANVLYVGDFNTYRSAEAGYQHLLAGGPGRALDPVNRPGSWHDNAAFVDVFTQAPAQSPPPPLVGGGLDDRFDFQLVTGELIDGQGLDILPGTYHAFGNNGSVPLDGAVNDPRNTALPDLPNRRQVLDLLTTVADHLPVVADYVVRPQVAALDSAALVAHLAVLPGRGGGPSAGGLGEWPVRPPVLVHNPGIRERPAQPVQDGARPSHLEGRAAIREFEVLLHAPAFCLARDRDVVITSWTDARIPPRDATALGAVGPHAPPRAARQARH